MKNRADFYSTAAKLQTGISLNPGLPFTHTTGSTLANALTVALAKEAAYQTARQARQAAHAAQRNTKTTARDFVSKARDVLRPYLGTKWSVAWAQVGFKNNSLALPRAQAKLRETLRLLTNYFSQHTTHQNTALGVTATAANAQFDAFKAAVQQSAVTKTAQRTARDERETAERQLGKCMKAVRLELRTMLEPNDTRWLDFVAQVPSDVLRPEPVTGLVASAEAPGELSLEWEPAMRAERYQIEIRVQGVDAEFRRVLTVHDELATVTNLTSGAQVTARVVAANDAGESVPSAEVTVTLPLAHAA
jgi:hypothetical protein